MECIFKAVSEEAVDEAKVAEDGESIGIATATAAPQTAARRSDMGAA